MVDAGPEGRTGKMNEYIAQMVPMLVLGGLVVAWLAEAAWRDGGYGYMYDMVVGLAGGLIMGSVTWLLMLRDTSMTTMLGLGGMGAGLAIVLQRSLWRSPPAERA
jgi:hypothetical protein